MYGTRDGTMQQDYNYYMLKLLMIQQTSRLCAQGDMRRSEEMAFDVLSSAVIVVSKVNSTSSFACFACMSLVQVGHCVEIR